MQNRENMMKSPMYRSQYQTNVKISQASSQFMHDSMICMGSPEQFAEAGNQKSSNSFSYNYERVDNMFRLINVKINNNDSKHEQNTTSRLERVELQLRQLSNKVAQLEMQQVKALEFNNLNRVVEQILTDIDSLTFRSDYLQQKLSASNRELADLKERVEEMEESSYFKQTGLEEIKSIKEISSDFQIKFGEFQKKVQRSINELQQSLKINIKRQEKGESQGLMEGEQKGEPSDNLQKTLKYMETYETEDGCTYLISETIYRVDTCGRLLDSSGFCLLTPSNREVKIKEQHLKKLRDFGILQ